LFEFAICEHQWVAIPLHFDRINKYVEEYVEFVAGDVGWPFKMNTCWVYTLESP
jgi:hypothetical protein